MDIPKEYLEKTPPNFPIPEKVGERLWGEEKLLCLVSGKFMLKEIKVKAGFKGGLQIHRKKNECGYLIEGEMILRHVNKKGILVERLLKPGDVFHFPPGVVHQEEAITNCIIIEASSPHFNDRVRMENLFGFSEIEGLPTTTNDEILEK